MRTAVTEASDMANETESLGAFLRAARETRGLSLDDAAQVTRIGKNYLTAIESDQFEKLPSATYTKGFIRIYAGYLGLSADDMVAWYDRLLQPAPRPIIAKMKSDEPDTSGKSGRSAAGRWLVPGLLLLMVLAAAYLFDDRMPLKRAPLREHPLPQQTAPPPAAPVQARVSSVQPAAVPPAAAPSLPASQAATPVESQGIVLKLKVNQDSRLSINIDGAITQQYDLKAGDLIEWKGERAFTLDIDNAGGVEGELNGRPLKPFGEVGKSAHVVLRGDERRQ